MECSHPDCNRPHHAKGLCQVHYLAQWENTKKCSVTGCARGAHGNGLCSMHWRRWKRTGSAEPIKLTLEERFWSKVDKSGECWLWTGQIDPGGYGSFSVKRNPRRAHRVAYELTKGPIPDGLLILHSCDNPPCVNPAHLRAGTQKENRQDAVDRRRTASGENCWNNLYPELRPRGENHGQAKLTAKQVAVIRRRANPGHNNPDNYTALGREFGVSHQTIRRIHRGETWSPQ